MLAVKILTFQLGIKEMMIKVVKFDVKKYLKLLYKFKKSLNF